MFPASHGYTQSAATYTAYTKSLICQMVSSALQHSLQAKSVDNDDVISVWSLIIAG